MSFIYNKDQTIEDLRKELKLKNLIIEKLEKSNDFYADEMNYTVDDDNGVSGEMRNRCVLYRDLEERNEAYSYAGKLARQTQKEVQLLKDKLMEGK